MPELMLVNPRKRKKRSRKTAVSRSKRRSNPIDVKTANPRRKRRSYSMRAVSRRRRCNPAPRFNLATFSRQTLVPSAVGAAGALGTDLLLGFLPLPAAIKTGPMRPLVRLVGAVGVGMLAGMVAGRKTGEQVAAGAVTVVLYDTLKGFAKQTMPNLPLGETEAELSAYIDESMGYVNPGMIADEGMSAYFPQEQTIGEYENVSMGEYEEV